MKIQIMFAALLLAVSSCSEKESVGEHSELILSGKVMFDGRTDAAVKPDAGVLEPLPYRRCG